MHEDRVIDIELSYDKQYYATAAKDGKVLFCDFSTNEILNTIEYHVDKVISQLSISYDNKFLAVGFSDGMIDIISLDDNFKKTLPPRKNAKLTLLKFVGYGHLLSATNEGETLLWDTYSDNASVKLLNDFTVSKSKVINTKINSNKNNIIAKLESNQLARWDIGQTKVVKYYEIGENMYSSDFLIQGGSKTSHIEYDTTLKFISTEETKIIEPPSTSKWRNTPYDYYDFDISPDGSKIAIVTNDNLVVIWNSNFTEKEVHINCHDFRMNDIEFSNNGRYLATSSIDKTLKIWDIYSGKLVNSIMLQKDWVTKIIFSDSTLIYGTYGGSIDFLPLD